MKRRERSIVSGFLAGLCFIAAVVHPGPVLAAESDGPEAEEAAAEEPAKPTTEELLTAILEELKSRKE